MVIEVGADEWKNEIGNSISNCFATRLGGSFVPHLFLLGCDRIKHSATWVLAVTASILVRLGSSQKFCHMVFWKTGRHGIDNA